MNENSAIRLFEDEKYVPHGMKNRENGGFPFKNVVAVLAENSDPKRYIKKMCTRTPELSANCGTICTIVQMIATDSKMRLLLKNL